MGTLSEKKLVKLGIIDPVQLQLPTGICRTVGASDVLRISFITIENTEYIGIQLACHCV